MSYQTELAYRRSAAEGASTIGLLTLLYDTLAGDLRRAAAAAAQNDIQARCKESNHALLVLGHLDSWINPADGEPLVTSLRTFYSYLRGEILRAQSTNSAAKLEDAATLVIETRAVWQRHEDAISRPAPATMDSGAKCLLGEQTEHKGANRFACSA